MDFSNLSKTTVQADSHWDLWVELQSMDWDRKAEQPTVDALELVLQLEHQLLLRKTRRKGTLQKQMQEEINKNEESV